MARAIILAISAAHADEILGGKRKTERRTRPPRELPAKALLAVSGTGTIVGECELGEPTRHSAAGWLLPIANPRRYAAPRPVAKYGLARIPRSFAYARQ